MGGSSPDKAGVGQYCQMVCVRRGWWKGVREEPAFYVPQVDADFKPGGYRSEAVRTPANGNVQPAGRPN
jgi:hypothetical protein